MEALSDFEEIAVGFVPHAASSDEESAKRLEPQRSLDRRLLTADVSRRDLTVDDYVR
jgi:hypothetical protein